MSGKGQLADTGARHVLATLADLDRALDRALRHAGIALPRALAAVYDDFSGDEIFLLGRAVTEVREGLVQLLAGLGISRGPPHISARWAVQTEWQFAEVALTELRDGSLASWGVADVEIQRRLAAEAERLRAQLARARGLLSEGHPGVRATPEELAPGPSLVPLRALLYLRELAPLYGALRAAATRLRDPDLAVGVFGRVSTGKSSLINGLLGEDVLPSSATPLTRTSVRLRHGDRALQIHTDDGSVRVRPWVERIDWLAGKRGDALRCEVRCPSVAPGTAWLDTPGLGATHPAQGAAAAHAVLECDIAIVCLGAGALPGLDERAVMTRAASQAVPVCLVVTQADRLRARERRALGDWLREYVGGTAQIAVVSTRGAPGLDGLRTALEGATQAPEPVRNTHRLARLRRLIADARDRVMGPQAEAALDAAASASEAMVINARQHPEG